MAEGSVNWAALIRKPQFWLRLAALLCSIVVIGVIADKGPIDNSLPDRNRCVFNLKEDACRVGIATGVITFLTALVFLVLDVIVAAKEPEESRLRILQVLDTAFSGAWALMWFICFCYLTNEWRVARPEYSSTGNKNAARASIAFAFFSVLIWGTLTVLAIIILRRNLGNQAGYETIEGTSSSDYDPTTPAPDIDQTGQTKDPSQP